MDVSVKPRMKIGKAERIRAQYSLDALDKKICEILYEFPATTYKELSALTGCTRKQVEWRMKKPSVRAKLAQMSKSKEDLIRDAKVLGLKRLMNLMTSKDEWVALQACKIALAGELMHGSKAIQSGDVGVIFETQVGEQGQIIQTMTRVAKTAATLPDPRTSTTLDLVMMAGIAQAPEGRD